MLAATRHATIARLVGDKRSMTNDELAAELGVSIETIRRDLDLLDKNGSVRRVRGGAVHKRTSVASEPSFPDRQDIAAEQKREIARQALELLDGARTVFVDIGTTAAAIASIIVDTFEGSVVTPSMHVAGILSTSRAIDVLVPGGRVRPGDMSISGPTARAFLADINPDVAFIGTGGVDLQAGITDFELAETDIKRVVIENSDRSYAVADSNKIGVRAPYHVCSLDAVTAIVSDSAVADADREAFAECGSTIRTGSHEN